MRNERKLSPGATTRSGPQRRLALQHAGCLQTVVHLSRVAGIGSPGDRLTLGPGAAHRAGREVRFDVQIGQQRPHELLDFAGRFHTGQDLTLEGVDGDRLRAFVFESQPLRRTTECLHTVRSARRCESLLQALRKQAARNAASIRCPVAARAGPRATIRYVSSRQSVAEPD